MRYARGFVFFLFCLMLLFGVAAGMFVRLPFSLPGYFLAAAGIGIITLLAFVWRFSLIAVVGIVGIGGMLGALRAGQVQEALHEATVPVYDGQEREFIGVIDRYPDMRVETTRAYIDLRYVKEPQGVREVSGRALAFLPQGAQVSFGDVVVLEGKVRLPKAFDGFNYPGYLAKDRVTALLSVNAVEKVGYADRPVGAFLASVRDTVSQVATTAVPYEEGAVLHALLLGDEGAMTEEFKEALNASGLRHIVAVSGMNITIIVTIVMIAGLGVGLFVRHAFFLAVGLIFFFVALIGFPASATRAALMGIALAAAPLIGRRTDARNSVAATGAAMAWWSPHALVYDIGFQLSFLAVLGILFVSPLLIRLPSLARLPRLPREAIAMTLAAQLFVVPLLLSSFGRISFIAPFTNLFVVPLLPLLTVYGLATVAVGAVSPWLAALVAFPIVPPLSFIVWVAKAGAAVPFAAGTFAVSHAILFAVLWYGALFMLLRRTYTRRPRPVDMVDAKAGESVWQRERNQPLLGNPGFPSGLPPTASL